MPSTIHYTHCPVCASDDLSNLFRAKDHTVSKEEFWVAACNNCGLRFTQDVPGLAEIASYYRSEDYISHTNTSRGLINRLYKVARSRTMKSKRKLIVMVTGLKQGAMLDIGSGTGAFVHEMETQGWKVLGLEPDAGARAIAKKTYNITIQEPNWLYELKENAFDAVTLWHVLEHVHDLHGYIERIKAVVKDEGRLFIGVPNFQSRDARWYKEYWAAYDVPRHLYHFSPGSMKILLEKHGLEIQEFKPLWYDGIYVSMLSSKNKHGWTNYFASSLIGLLSNLRAVFNTRKCSSILYVIRKTGSRTAPAITSL